MNLKRLILTLAAAFFLTGTGHASHRSLQTPPPPHSDTIKVFYFDAENKTTILDFKTLINAESAEALAPVFSAIQTTLQKLEKIDPEKARGWRYETASDLNYLAIHLRANVKNSSMSESDTLESYAKKARLEKARNERLRSTAGMLAAIAGSLKGN